MCFYDIGDNISFIFIRQKGRDLSEFYDRGTYTNRNSKTAKRQHKNAIDPSITKRLWTYLERSVEVTTVIQLLKAPRYKSRDLDDKTVSKAPISGYIGLCYVP